MTEIERKKVEWLSEYAGIQMRIDRMELEIEKWRTQLEGMGAQLIDGMPRSHGNKKDWEKAILEIERLNGELTRELLNLRTKRQTIIDAINEMKTPILQVLIERRYLDGLRWEEICAEMHYSWRQVHYMHIKALRQIRMQDCI